MSRLTASYLQHRNSIGHFNQIQNKKQPAQKQHEKHCNQLAARPGLHQGNIRKQTVAYAMVHLLATLSSVRNTEKMIDAVSRNRSEIGSSERENTRGDMFVLNSEQNDNIAPHYFKSTPNKERFRPSAVKDVAPMNLLVQTSDSDNFTFTPVMAQMTPVFKKGLVMLIEPIVAALHYVDHFLVSYDPLKFPGTTAKAIPPHSETLVSDSTIHLRHAHSMSPEEIEQKKKQVLHYLFAHGYSNETLFSQKEVAVATLSTLFFCSDPSSLRKRPEEVRILAKRFLAEQDLYGGKEEETLSLRQAESVFSDWMFCNVLSMSLEDYVIRKIAMDKYPTYFSVNTLQVLLSPETLRNERKFHLHNIPKTEWDNFCRMWFFCLHQKMPFLKLKEAELKDILLSEDSFAGLYAGSRFLDEAADKDPFYTLEEAITTGKEIWDITLSEKEITQDKIRYFRVPALLFMTQKTPQRINQEKNLEKIGLVAINEYMQYLGDVDTLSKNITQKYENYQTAVGAWMSKKKLSEKVVAELPLNTLYLYFPRLRTIQDGKEKEALIRSARLSMEKRYLESGSLNSRYDKLTSDVADSFYEFDKYLIESTLLKDNEFHRIFFSDAVLRPVFFNMEVLGSGAYTAHAIVPIMYHIPKDVIRARLEKTDLISVSVKGEERIYALKANQNIEGVYRLIQVDRDIWRYIRDGLLDYKGFGSDYKISGEKVITNKGEFSVTIRTEMNEIICKAGETHKLVEFLSKKHHKELYDSLHKSGDYETENEKAWNIVKHIIPFYDCVDGIIRKDSVQAAPACFYDSVPLLPVVGEAASLSQKFGMLLAKGIVKGMAKNGMTLTKHSFSTIAATAVREISLPTTSELVSLGKMALQGVDPGIELLTGLSKKLGKKVAMRLSSDKKNADLAKKIGKVQSFEELPSELEIPIKTATLPDSNIKVPVKKIGQDGLDDIYAQINPDTGEIFGYRYKIDEKNTLVRQVSNKPVHSKTNAKEIKTLGRSEEASHVKDMTSRYISKKLEKSITPEMYEQNIDQTLLSSPDQYGLKKDADGNTFLVLKGGYIKINKINENRFLLGPTFSPDRITIRFDGNQFVVEKFAERAQNILNIGMSGRGAIGKKLNEKISVSSIIGPNEGKLPLSKYSKLLSQAVASSNANSIAESKTKTTFSLIEFDRMLSEILGLPDLKIGTLLMTNYKVRVWPKVHYKLVYKKEAPRDVQMSTSYTTLTHKQFYELVCNALDLPDLKIDFSSIVRSNIRGSHLRGEELRREATLLSEEIKSVKSSLKVLSKVEPEVKLLFREFNALLSAYMVLVNDNAIRIPLLQCTRVRLPLREFDHFLSVILELPNLNVGTLLMEKSEITLSPIEYYKLSSKSVDSSKSGVKLLHEEFYELVSNYLHASDLEIGTFRRESQSRSEALDALSSVIQDLPDLKIGDFSVGGIEAKLSFMEFTDFLSKYTELFNAKKSVRRYWRSPKLNYHSWSLITYYLQL